MHEEEEEEAKEEEEEEEEEVEEEEAVATEEEERKSPLPVFRLLSDGLKWMVGMGQTSCIGLGSTKVLPFFSHPAPSRNRPLTHTPSWRWQNKGTLKRPF